MAYKYSISFALIKRPMQYSIFHSSLRKWKKNKSIKLQGKFLQGSKGLILVYSLKFKNWFPFYIFLILANAEDTITHTNMQSFLKSH